MTRRAAYMKDLAAVLRRNTEQYARLMSLEMGKPIGEAGPRWRNAPG